MKNIISTYWASLSDVTRDRILSAVRVFVTTFITTFGMIMTSGNISWSWPFLFSVASTALNAAVKALMQSYAPVSLGGIRK